MPFSDKEDEKLPDYFVDSSTIQAKAHVDIQAAAQKCGSALIYSDESELFGDDHILSKISQIASRGMPTGKFVFTGTTTAFLQGLTA